MKKINKVKTSRIIILQLLILILFIGSCSVSKYSLKSTLTFFSDSIVPCDSYFKNCNVILSDTIIPLSLNIIFPQPCEKCKNGKNELKKDFPSRLISKKQIKLNNSILKDNNIIQSFDSGSTIKAMINGGVKLKSKEELIIIKCLKKGKYDTGILEVYILLKKGKVTGWCLSPGMIPTPNQNK